MRVTTALEERVVRRPEQPPAPRELLASDLGDHAPAGVLRAARELAAHGRGRHARSPGDARPLCPLCKERLVTTTQFVKLNAPQEEACRIEKLDEQNPLVKEARDAKAKLLNK